VKGLKVAWGGMLHTWKQEKMAKERRRVAEDHD